MAISFTAILPSGRAVKYTKLKTSQFFDGVDAATVRAGKNAAEAKLTRQSALETIAICLKAISPAPVEWKFKLELADGKPVLDETGKLKMSDEVDVDAMLDSVDAVGGIGWTPLTYLDLVTKDGPKSVMALFDDELEDFTQLSMRIQEASFPQRARATSLAKVRATSGG